MTARLEAIYKRKDKPHDHTEKIRIFSAPYVNFQAWLSWR